MAVREIGACLETAAVLRGREAESGKNAKRGTTRERAKGEPNGNPVWARCSGCIKGGSWTRGGKQRDCGGWARCSGCIKGGSWTRGDKQRECGGWARCSGCIKGGSWTRGGGDNQRILYIYI